jgi:hypothetical protein
MTKIGLSPLGVLMKLRIDCTANLGDFCNALPVISGISKRFDQKIELFIRPEMRKFAGIKQFLKYQPMFSEVYFHDEVFNYGDILTISSWTRMDQEAADRPIETCRYENWVRDNYQLEFQVDDDFEIEVDPMVDTVIETTTKTIIGDRWSSKQDPNIDTRRNTNVVEGGTNLDPNEVFYLDYTKPIMYNLNLIKNSPKPFITTFTGIGIIADLMHKETIVCWDEDMRIWDGHGVEFDFKRHYYGDRNAKLVYVKDLVL